jgi:hypothetical protein
MNLRGWRGIQEVREALHAEGIQVDRIYAELIADICRGQFSPAEFLAERDNFAYWNLSGVRVDGKVEWEPEPPRPIEEIRKSYLVGMSQGDRNRLVEVPILERKIAEWHLIPSDCTEYVMRNDDIRKFALKIAERHGFKKIKARFGPISPVIAKEDVETGVKVCFGLCGSPKDGGLGLLRRFDFDFRYFITDALLVDSVELNIGIFSGMAYYQALSGLPDSNYNFRTDNPEQMEFWSEIIKIGIVALVRFLDLFHASIVKFRKEQDASK